MKKRSLLAKGYATLENMCPGTIVTAVTGNVIRAFRPFLNIYFPARIIWILSNTKSIPDLLLNIGLSVTLNLLLSLFGNHFEQLIQKRQTQTFQEERNCISRKLFCVDYPTLENAAFAAKVNKYKENRWSPFMQIVWISGSWAQGIVGLICASVLLSPFFKVMFLRTGEGFFQSPWLSVVLLAAIVICAPVIVLMSSHFNKKCYQERNKYLDINRIFSFYTDLLMNYNSGKEIRLFEEQDLIEKHATRELIDKGEAIQNKVATYRAASSACYALIAAVLGFGIYAVIGLKASAGLFGTDSLVRFVGSFLQIVIAITNLTNTTGHLGTTIRLLGEFFDIVETESTSKGNLAISAPKTISFQNVSFSYEDKNSYALQNITMEIPMGERIAIVGENGSGKTTFIKLLCGLYNVSEGEVFINGININHHDLEEYRKLFSVIFQDFKMFSLALGENIAASTEYDAAKANQVIEYVDFAQRLKRMSKGLQSYLYHDCDKDGIEISGGEAQKLAIARALYKDAPIIVLDEPTAALDPFAEQELYKKFDTLVKGKTVFYISHRLSSCFFCNKIAVFDKGNLVQFGTHDTLLADKGGKYHELWNAQAQYYV